MREVQLQTPDRRQKKLPKKPEKIAKKCLFKSISEDAIHKSSKDSLESPLISEVQVFDDDQLSESPENYAHNPLLTPLEKVRTSYDLTPMLSTITVGTGFGEDSVSRSRFAEQNDEMTVSSLLEAEMVVNSLKQARFQVLNSKNNVDQLSRKLLDALIEIVIVDHLNGLPDGKEWADQLLSRRIRVLFLSFLLWIFVALIAFFFKSGGQGSFRGPLAT